jgi:hypothetical protein
MFSVYQRSEFEGRVFYSNLVDMQMSCIESLRGAIMSPCHSQSHSAIQQPHGGAALSFDIQG